MKVLSIDWDWFFPNVADYDWGHSEEPMFQVMFWSLRAGNRNLITGKWAIEEMVPDESRLKDFWNLQAGDPFMLAVVESHKDMYDVLRQLKRIGAKVDQVFNMDAHHDVFYGKKPPVEKKWMHCGNWAYWCWKDKLLKEYTVVYPPWRRKEKEEEPVRGDLGWMKIGFEPIRQHYDVIFICRSSAWTPSWSDDAWLNFVEHWKKVPWLWESRITCQFVQSVRAPTMEQALVLRDNSSKMISDMMKGVKHDSKRTDGSVGEVSISGADFVSA